MPCRSTLSDANLCLNECIFEAIYGERTPLISTCFPRTADGAGVQSGSNACKSSIRRPYPSSPISFSKASAASEDREKEGGIKVHANIHANEFVPSDIRFTSAAKGDSFMLRPSNYHSGDILAFDRAYIDYAKFEEMTEAGVTYFSSTSKIIFPSDISIGRVPMPSKFRFGSH